MFVIILFLRNSNSILVWSKTHCPAWFDCCFYCDLIWPRGFPETFFVKLLCFLRNNKPIRCDPWPEWADTFKVAIARALKAKGQSVVFFERCFRSPHLQIQCVPVSSAKDDLVRDVFVDVAAMQSVTLDEVPDHAEIRQGTICLWHNFTRETFCQFHASSRIMLLLNEISFEISISYMDLYFRYRFIV